MHLFYNELYEESSLLPSNDELFAEHGDSFEKESAAKALEFLLEHSRRSSTFTGNLTFLGTDDSELFHSDKPRVRPISFSDFVTASHPEYILQMKDLYLNLTDQKPMQVFTIFLNLSL